MNGVTTMGLFRSRPQATPEQMTQIAPNKDSAARGQPYFVGPDRVFFPSMGATLEWLTPNFAPSQAYAAPGQPFFTAQDRVYLPYLRVEMEWPPHPSRGIDAQGVLRSEKNARDAAAQAAAYAQEAERNARAWAMYAAYAQEAQQRAAQMQSQTKAVDTSSEYSDSDSLAEQAKGPYPDNYAHGDNVRGHNFYGELFGRYPRWPP